MKKSFKCILATVLSCFMIFAAVSPAFAYSANDITGGQVITVNQTVKDSIENSDTVKSFAFDIPTDGYFNVSLKPSADANNDRLRNGWHIEIYNNSDFQNSIMSGYGKNYTSYNYGTGAGRYYAVVTLPSYGADKQNFDLTVNYQASSTWEKEDNDASTNANLISLDTTYKGNLVTREDVDWYAFDITGRGYFNIYLAPDASTDKNGIGDGWNLNLYNASGQTMEYWTDFKEGYCVAEPLPAGRYYLQISQSQYSGNDNGLDYDLTIKYTATDDWEIESNDESNQATAINLNKTYHGILQYKDDVDWYSFKLNKKSKIRFNFAQNAADSLDTLGDGWNVELKDSKNTYIKFEYAKSPQYQDVELYAGTYYIDVYRYGSYPGANIYDLKVSLLSQEKPVKTPKKTPTKKTKMKLGRVSIRKVKAGKRSLRVNWKKVKKAKSYQVAYKSKKGKKWTVKKTKKLSYTIKKLKAKKKYNVRVRAVSGKKTGAWSKVKTVKTK